MDYHRPGSTGTRCLRSLYATFCDDPDEVEARCMLSFSLLIGNHFIAADHGPRSRADVLSLSLRHLGAAPSPSPADGTPRTSRIL